MLVHESVPLPLREYRALLYTWCLVKSTFVYLLPLLYFCVYLSLMFMYMIYEPASLALDNSRLSVGHFLYTYLCSSKDPVPLQAPAHSNVNDPSQTPSGTFPQVSVPPDRPVPHPC